MAIGRWNDYPKGHSDFVIDPFQFDLDHYDHLLRANSNRLFVSDEEIRLRVIEAGGTSHTFKSFQDLDDYLTTSTFQGTRVILVGQEYSWGRLLVSENGAKRILSHLGAFPPVLDVLHVFGEQTEAISDSIGGFQAYNNGTTFECCYLVKHVEEHGRGDDADPWSIRQMGLYHHWNRKTDSSTFLIINPSKAFQRRLKNCLDQSPNLPTWRDIHSLISSAATLRWRWYITHLESQLAALKTKAQIASVSDKGCKSVSSLEVDFGDTQDIQVIQDKLQQLSLILATNLSVFEALAGRVNSSVLSGGFLGEQQATRRNMFGEMSITETSLQVRRIETMLQRLSAASGLMQNIISFQGLEALNANSSASTALMKIARQENSLMLKLAKKSQRDARTLKTITILTMIYLPASFVSQLLSMGYISLAFVDKHLSIHLKEEMWIFGFLTLLFLTITILLWVTFEKRARRKERKQTPPNAADLV